METIKYRKDKTIYIPIWLDLLSLRQLAIRQKPCHLHSNMVRFIIQVLGTPMAVPITFTFQYG